jgi:amidase
MPVSVPTPDQLKYIAAEMGLALTDADIDSFITLMKPSIEGYNVVDSLPNNLPPVTYPRTPGHRPGPEENKHNAWYYKSTVQGAPAGKLKRTTREDNVMLAGARDECAFHRGHSPVDAT